MHQLLSNIYLTEKERERKSLITFLFIIKINNSNSALTSKHRCNDQHVYSGVCWIYFPTLGKNYNKFTISMLLCYVCECYIKEK